MAASAHTDFAGDLGFIEGPVWDAANATLSVVSIDRGLVYTLDWSGRRVREVSTGGGPNGMVLGQHGLLVAQNGGIFGASGPAAPGVQAIEGPEARYAATDGFTAPNDLAFGPDGRLYVTDPQTDRAVLEPIPGKVFACDPATGRTDLVIDGRMCPNGLAFTADGRHLLLAQTQARVIERFAFDGGVLTPDGEFCALRNGRPDGLAIDEAGQVWVCTPGTGGIEVYDADGGFLQRIEIGADSMTTNLCFGGKDRRQLFVTAARWGKIVHLAVEVPGLYLRDERGDSA